MSQQASPNITKEMLEKIFSLLPDKLTADEVIAIAKTMLDMYAVDPRTRLEFSSYIAEEALQTLLSSDKTKH